MIDISIKAVGIKKIKDVLLKIKKQIKDLRSQFRPIGSFLLSSIDRNFQTEGSFLGKPWAPLAPATIADRASKGFGARHPILQRTGKLRRGFKADIGRTTLVIRNAVSYFPQHQVGLGIPQRAMMLMNRRLAEDIANMLLVQLYGNL